MLRRMIVSVVPLLAVLWTGACASSGTTAKNTQTGEQAALSVEVNNDLTVPATLTVWLVGQNTSAQLLGTAEPGSRRVFTVNQSIVPGTYVLRARTTSGSILESNPFNLEGGDSVSWDLNLNTIQTR